jgi:hypothetical protein
VANRFQNQNAQDIFEPIEMISDEVPAKDCGVGNNLLVLFKGDEEKMRTSFAGTFCSSGVPNRQTLYANGSIFPSSKSVVVGGAYEVLHGRGEILCQKSTERRRAPVLADLDRRPSTDNDLVAGSGR